MPALTFFMRGNGTVENGRRREGRPSTDAGRFEDSREEIVKRRRLVAAASRSTPYLFGALVFGNGMTL